MREVVVALGLLGLSLTTLLAVDPARLATLHLDLPHYHDVYTHELKEWIDYGQPLVILDVRTKDYDDGKRLPKALLFPYDNSNEQISATLPNKEAQIVVYCTNEQSPTSQYFANRLVALGYRNVYKYPEGIAAWEKAGYPIDISK